MVRKIIIEDMGDLAKLYEVLGEGKCSIDKMNEKFKLIEGNKDYYLLGYEYNNKIVGTCMGIVCMDLCCDYDYFMTIENVIVSEKYRGMGICTQIMNELEKIARKRNCSYIYLVSGKQRKAAHTMYRKLGYGEDGALGFRKYL